MPHKVNRVFYAFKVLAVSVVVLCVGLLIAATVYDHFHVTCVSRSIPYSTDTTVIDPDLQDGQSKITQVGVDGLKQVCTRTDGTVISSKTLSKPVEQVTSYGSNIFSSTPVTEDSDSTFCPVTTCSDGSCSMSTGRGTCSWHGGIAY